MSRRVASAAVLFVLAALLATAAPASAQTTDLGIAPTVSPFGHDDTLDAPPATEIVSGVFGGDDGDNTNGDALADRVPNTWEAFEFRVPEGANLGSFTVTVTWQDPRLDLDLYLYRRNPANGVLAPTSIGSSATFGDTDESTTYYNAIASDPIEPDSYVIVVDNWCTRNGDAEAQAQLGGCGITDAAGVDVDVPDEDDFVGTVSFGPRLPSNALPTVALGGPDAVKAGSTATFTATAADAGGLVRNYAFDLDGDGRFELDNGTVPSVTKRFETPGRINVGVRVTDDLGGRSYADRLLAVQAPPTKQLLSRFALDRPVFGGRGKRPLKVSYRLREAGTVTLDLYRGKQRVKRFLTTQARAAGKTYTQRIGAKGRRRGAYTVRIAVRTPGGRTQSARIHARRL